MPTSPRSKRERPSKTWYGPVVKNLRSQLTWTDFLIGIVASLVVAFLLTGFRTQAVPEYELGEIAAQEVRALQDLSYEDGGATARAREAARATVPSVYDFKTDLISNVESEISQSFEAARQILEQNNVPTEGQLEGQLERRVLQALREKIEASIPHKIMPLLLKYRFGLMLEGQLIQVFDAVSRSGVVDNHSRFLRDQRAGIVLRDLLTSVEQLLPDTYVPRDVLRARNYLSRLQLEITELTSSEREQLAAFLETRIVPTLVLNVEETSARREEAAAAIPAVEIQIKQGKTVVRNGDEITSTVLTQLEALRSLQKPQSVLGRFLGFLLYALIFVYVLWRYFVHHQSRHRAIRSHTVLILLILTSVLCVTRLMTGLADILSERMAIPGFQDPFNLYYAIPFAFGAILVTLLVDTSVSVYFTLTTASLVGLFYGDVYLTVYVVVSSLSGIYSIRQYKDRAAILKAGITIAVVNCIAYFGIDFLRQDWPSLSDATFQISMAFASGILASTLVSILLPALETIFKITTDIRLLELSNLNAPILRKLSVEAPGTYHHSLMVGTLAEAGAEGIGANPLLVRVAAYYHDLGKMLKPEYFVENQIYGVNKHENLSPSMSCLIIASHVKDGLELAKEIGLAERIRDMIPQHHGTRIMTYFYNKAKESLDSKNQEIIETDFRYPGPKPQSKEAAIMMMADSVEAASRTLTNPTPAQIQGMIDRITDAIISDNQFEQCDITLREIDVVKDSFCKILKGIYHRRIDYPGFNFKELDGETEKSFAHSRRVEQAETI